MRSDATWDYSHEIEKRKPHKWQLKKKKKPETTVHGIVHTQKHSQNVSKDGCGEIARCDELWQRNHQCNAK